MLVVIGGLPGTGKTTIARQLASRAEATYLRIDAIEQALRASLGIDIGPAGYEVAYALSEANLVLGRLVIADCVNPLAITRAAWRNVAKKAASPVLEVEIICSETALHQQRIESRETDIPGLILPTWSAVMARDYEPWVEPRLVMDTAKMTAGEAALAINVEIERLRS